MKFSLSYNNKSKTKADEIKCKYSGLGYYFNFILKNPDKRYCIILPSQEDEAFYKEIDKIIPVVKDYTIECGSILSLKNFLDKGYHAFLRHPASDWETFNQLKSLGVSDVYIDGPLGFQVEYLRQAKESILLRASPTVSPNAALLGMKPNSFFIRPEDLHLYEGTIDIIDFKSENNPEREEALFSIFKLSTFNYDLVHLMETKELESLNFLLPQDFGEQRLNCRQRCQMPQSRCSYCNLAFRVSNKLLDYSKQEGSNYEMV